jgi:glucose dehydrogenase
MFTSGRVAALASISLAAMAMPAFAVDVTFERLLNAPNDPANWLMVHRDYNNSRHSPLTEVNATNAKDLKLKFIMSIGGRTTAARCAARRSQPRSSMTASCMWPTPGRG